MPTIVSIASGKGGVGKSVVTSNLALLFARGGRRVVLADLDVSGANQHVLFGLMSPPTSLTDFITRAVERLDDVLVELPLCSNLRLLPGTGETLATANPSYGAKQRLIRHIRRLDAEIVLVDIGAGSNYHALDFFLMADHHVIVSTPDPTAIFDVYKFIKLAAIRQVLAIFMARSLIGNELSTRDFSSIEEILNVIDKSEVAEGGADAKSIAEEALLSFLPLLVMNRVGKTGARLNILQLRRVLNQYVGSALDVLGEIPVDPAVERSVATYLPVVDCAPRSPASSAIQKIYQNLVERVTRRDAAA